MRVTSTGDLILITGCHRVSAYVIAEDVKNFLTQLNPASAQKYEAGLKALQNKDCTGRFNAQGRAVRGSVNHIHDLSSGP